MKIVFLLEEPSMAALLELLLPRLLPGVECRCVAHRGKSDLEASIPRKLRGWREPGVRFVVMRDQDSGDCRMVKARLRELCEQGGKPDTLVRVVCRELEAWFLADLAAVERGLQVAGLGRRQMEAKFRQPDRIGTPSRELKSLVPRVVEQRPSLHTWI